jgi:hypothetical protein
MGTLIRDSLAATLADGSNITASADGTGVRVGFPGHVQVEVVTGTVTGSSPKCDIEIQGCWVSDFSANVVSYGFFEQLDGAGTDDAGMDVYADSPYMRAVYVVSGTSPVFPLTIKVREAHDRRVTPGPGMPTAPGTGTGSPDATND